MSFETWHAFLVAAVLASVSPGAVACMMGSWNVFSKNASLSISSTLFWRTLSPPHNNS
jgi:hypothetical protein